MARMRGWRTGMAVAALVLVGPSLVGAATPAGATVVGVRAPRCAGADQLGADRSPGWACDAGVLQALPAPEVAGSSPNVGVTTGGTPVTIRGSGFVGAVSVRFGPTAATTFAVVDDTTIAAVAPARPAGLVNLRVEGPGGASATGPPSWFRYGEPPTAAPTVSSVTPDIGTVDGGTEVVISGSGFLTASNVRFGPSTEATFTVRNDSTITAVAPAHAAALVSVRVTNPAGTSTSHRGSWFSFREVTGPPPTVSSLSSHIGPAAGGAAVTISGTGLGDVTQVRFGPSPAATFAVVDATTIVAVTPARPVGLVNVSVTSPNGTSPNQLTSHYWFR